jgi:glucose-1-phosphatase
MKIEIPEGITTLLLDLGGVILDLHLKNTYTAFEKLGFHHFHQHFDSYSGSNFIENFEEGKITAQEFIATIKNYCNPNTSTTQIIASWNAMLGELPVHKFEMLQHVKEEFQIILYSNTNEIHVEYLNQYYNQTFGYQKVQNIFDHIYYSQELGIRKPKSAGFEKIMANHNLKPEEIFYIDDGKQHIATAKLLGINTLLWKQNESFL